MLKTAKAQTCQMKKMMKKFHPVEGVFQSLEVTTLEKDLIEQGPNLSGMGLRGVSAIPANEE